MIDENAENYATIEEMNSSPNQSAECFGTVRIDVPEGFHYSDFPDADCESFPECDMEIRGRGNTTWGATKKPYKIKLAKKKSMLGFGKNKHWVLIANAYDRTLIKDRMTGWLGDAIKLEFTPRGVPVDLVMKNTNGTYNKYLGSYYLSENVRVDENRVDIHELKEGDMDPDIVSADPNGVLHALKAGSATVKVQSVVQDPETGYARELIDKCKVYVTGPNTMKVKGKTVKMKYAALKNGSKKIRRAKAVTVRKARGKVTYTLKGVSGSKYRNYFSVSKKTGNIVVKKGIRKGTYKLRINVRAAGDKAFRPKAKTVTVKIKISN